MTVKALHVTVAMLSLAGFIARAYLMFVGSARLQLRWVRIAPHVVDTVLLLSGLYMAFLLRVLPSEHAWFAAKLIALVCYIVLGSVALRRGPSMVWRAAAFALSLLVFAYIIAVANTREVVPWLSIPG